MLFQYLRTRRKCFFCGFKEFPMDGCQWVFTSVEWCSSIWEQGESLFSKSLSTSKLVPFAQILAPWDRSQYICDTFEIVNIWWWYVYVRRFKFQFNNSAVVVLYRQHCCVTICCYFCWVWQIQNTKSEANPNNNLTMRRASEVKYHTDIRQGILLST